MVRVVRASLFGLACVGCYSPTPPAGTPCPTGVCPSGLVCSPLTMTCEDHAQFDARPDTPTDAPPGCFGVGIVTVCPDTNITGQDTIVIQTITTLTTTTSSSCEPYHLPDGTADDGYCVIAAKSITVTSAGRWNITGTKPLVLLGQTAVAIDGLIDIASHRGGQAGAGADPAACVAGAAPSGPQGGPGGTFGTAGGDGGGYSDGARSLASQPPSTIAMLRGGCAGVNGGGANGGGGRGGGALALISQGAIRIDGTINASGAGASGGGLVAGGGGGGSGGMIVLDAPTVTVTGAIVANGGGGGEGGGGSNPGNSGSDPNPTTPLVAARGGSGNAGGGGDGGDGAAGAVAANAGQTGNRSGGGGGGAHGVIRVFPSQNLGGVISPQPR